MTTLQKYLSIVLVCFFIIFYSNIAYAEISCFDNLPDWIEMPVMTPSTNETDTDGDGLTDWDELYIWGTDPCDVDTDDDFLWDGDEVYTYGTLPTNNDTDQDGLLDGAEVLAFKTDPTNPSTDGDPYDDKQEIFGVSEDGTPMPGYIESPGDNVFVAAHPVIEIIVDEDISIEEIPIITFEHGNWEEEEIGYSVANMEGSSYSVGTTGSHTTGSWVDVSNSEEDSEQKALYEENISISEEKYWTGYSQGKTSEVEVGVEAGVAVSVVGPSAYAKVSASVKETVTTGGYQDDYQGKTSSVRTGGEVTTEKIRATSTSHGSKEESTFSATITKTSYNETTVTNSNAIATGVQWTTATTVDSGNAGKLRFRFWLKNTGTDVAEELNDLQFNIYIGDNLPITIYGPDKSNLWPGGETEIGVDVQITLEELKAIDKGEPIKIIVADYSYGQKEIDYENAWGRDVLVEIDDGIADGDELIDYYMTWVNYGEDYIDVLKRLNLEVQIGHPFNKRREIELTLEPDDNDPNMVFITSIENKPVTEWSWWNIYIQDLDNTADHFADQPATKKSRLLLVYNQDSDHDYYNDRIETKIGTDPQDIDSHPSPILIVGKYVNPEDPNVIKLKFSNVGNYDAYGIDAILYSPDDTTSISDSIIGDGGRIEAGRSFIPEDTFKYIHDPCRYVEPVVLIRYNDPQGFHSFITKLNLMDPCEDIGVRSIEMLPTEMTVKTRHEYMFYQDNWLMVDYFNPEEIIYDANIVVAYQDLNGSILEVQNKIVNIQQGHNSFVFQWNPSVYLGKENIGDRFKAVIIISDYQGVEIAFDVQKFTIVTYPADILVDTFSGGIKEMELAFSDAGSKEVYINIPRDCIVTNAYLQIEGGPCSGDPCNLIFPTSPWLEIGQVDGIREWSLNLAELQKQRAFLGNLNDGSTNKTLQFVGDNYQTIYLRIPKQALVTSAMLTLSGYYSDPNYSFVYDDFSDSYIDPCLWIVHTDFSGGLYIHASILEQSIYMRLRASCGASGHANAYAESKAMPNIDSIQRLTIVADLLANHTQRGSGGDITYAKLDIFGNNMLTLTCSGGNACLLEDHSIWTLIKNVNAGINIFDVYRDGSWQSQITTSSNIIRMNIYAEKYGYDIEESCGGRGHFYLINYDVKVALKNPYLEVGMPDGVYEWYYNGDFTIENILTNDITHAINTHLKTCLADTEGYCEVPLIFHSDTSGNLKVSDVDISYIDISKTKDVSSAIYTSLNNGNCDCDGCIVEDNCCYIPITVHSDSPGIIKLSNLRIIYEPTECDYANIDGEDFVDIIDFNMLINEYLQSGTILLTDINKDDKIDLLDFNKMALQWLANCNCN